MGDLIVGALVGIATSIVSWLMIVHALRPKIRVSNFISRSYGHDDELEFRIKLQNGRRWRSAVDLRLDAYVWLPGYRRPTSNELIPIDIDGEDFVGLRPGHRKVVRLSVSPDRSPAIEDLAIAGLDVTVEDLLRAALLAGRVNATPVDEEPELRLWLAYTDGYSGVRRASFHRYTYGDIAAVMFDERSVGRGRPAVKSE